MEGGRAGCEVCAEFCRALVDEVRCIAAPSAGLFATLGAALKEPAIGDEARLGELTAELAVPALQELSVITLCD